MLATIILLLVPMTAHVFFLTDVMTLPLVTTMLLHYVMMALAFTLPVVAMKSVMQTLAAHVLLPFVPMTHSAARMHGTAFVPTKLQQMQTAHTA